MALLACLPPIAPKVPPAKAPPAPAAQATPPPPLGQYAAEGLKDKLYQLLAMPSFAPLERCPQGSKASLKAFLQQVGDSYAVFVKAAAPLNVDVRPAANAFIGSVLFSGVVPLFGPESIPPPSDMYPLLATYASKQSTAQSTAALAAASEAVTRASQQQRAWGGGGRGSGSDSAGGGAGSDHKKARDNNSNPKASGSGKIASWTIGQLVTHFSAMSPYPPAWVSKANWDKERPQGSCKYHLPPIVGAKRQARGPQCDGTDANCHWKVLFAKGASVLEAHPTSRYIKTHSVIPPEVGQSARSANAGKDWFGG